MANLFQLKTGKLLSFIGKLAEKGFTAEMAEAVDRDPDLAAAIVIAIKRHPSFALVHGLFAKPEDQITRMRVWNKQFGWEIRDKAFAEAEKLIPMWPEKKLVAVTLVPYLEENDSAGGIERTFRDLWLLAASQQKSSWRWGDFYNADPDHLRLLAGIGHTAGLRWEVIDLGCHRGEKSCDVRSPKSSPHAGILAAAALHPQWVKAMNGKDVPFILLPGYEIYVPGSSRGPWTHIPALIFESNGCVGLCHSPSTNIDEFSMPSFVGEPIPIL